MSQSTYLEAIRTALFEEMERDENVVVMGEDVGHYGGAFRVTKGLLDRYGPERVIDTPVAEEALVGAAIGASYAGMRPVVEFQFIDFSACAFDMIVNFAATSRYRWGQPCPITMRGPSGGGVHGGPFHSRNPEMWFAHSPGLKVVAPATPRDARGLLKSAIRDDDPVIFLENKFLYRRIKDEVPKEDAPVPIGKARVAREGDDLTIVTYSAMTHDSLAVAEELGRDGTSVEVVDLRSIYPIDRDTIVASVRKTNKLLVVHEDTRTGGVAGEIAMLVMEEAFEDLDGPVVRVTAPDTPVPFSPPLEEAFRPNAKVIAMAARRLAKY